MTTTTMTTMTTTAAGPTSSTSEAHSPATLVEAWASSHFNQAFGPNQAINGRRASTSGAGYFKSREENRPWLKVRTRSVSDGRCFKIVKNPYTNIMVATCRFHSAATGVSSVTVYHRRDRGRFSSSNGRFRLAVVTLMDSQGNEIQCGERCA